MKKTFLALLLFTGITASSQSITAGLKGGVNISNFTGGDFEDVKKKALFGFHAGGYLNFALGGFSIQPELLVSTAGAKFEMAGESENFKLTYITVPVMARLKSPVGFYIEAGPQVGFKISESIGDETINDFAKGLDLSLGGGLGFQAGGIGIGARYLAGLSKVGDFESSEINPDFKNGIIQVGISFRLGGK